MARRSAHDERREAADAVRARAVHEIHFRLARRVVPVLQHVADDADDLGLGGGLALVERTKAHADRARSGEELTHELLVDDRRAHAAGRIALVEEAPVLQPQLHRLCIAGRHDITQYASRRRLAAADSRGQRHARDRGHRHQRQHVRRAGRRHTRRRANAFKQTGDERMAAHLEVVPLRQLHAHDLHLIGVVAGVDARQPQKTVREQRGADGEHDGEGGFDDEQAKTQPAAVWSVRTGADRSLAAAKCVKEIDARAPQRRNESRDYRGGH